MEEIRTISLTYVPLDCRRRTVTQNEMSILQITYHIDYQYKLPGDNRPIASGSLMRSSAGETPLMFLPAEGDFVEISGNPTQDETLTSFSGRVVSRLFRYER